MFEYIKGILVEIAPDSIIVEANNIGYKIFLPPRFSSCLPDLQKEICCFVSFVVKEDSHTLYGFLKKEERNLFNLLKNISGIGPKTALAIIGHFEVFHFHQAILHGDTHLLSKVPGIGKKTAERLIIDIKDKLHILEKDLVPFSSLEKKENSYILDAVNALIRLGYHRLQAQKLIQQAAKNNKEEKDVGTLISLALRKSAE